MKVASIVFALASVVTLAGTSLADHRPGPGPGPGPNPGPFPPQHDEDLLYAAQDVKADAEALTEALARSGSRYPNREVYNAGLVAKEANDLVNVLDGYYDPSYPLGSVDQELYDVLNAFRQLKDAYYYAGRHSYYVDQAFFQLEGSVHRLENGGSPWNDAPGHGRDDGGVIVVR